MEAVDEIMNMHAYPTFKIGAVEVGVKQDCYNNAIHQPTSKHACHLA
jgi:hypothetical protein